MYRRVVALSCMLIPLAAWSVPAAFDDVHEIVSPLDGRKFYVEERAAADANGPILDGFVDASIWIYEETNGLAGLQRGGIGLLGDWFPPGCDQDSGWTPLSGTIPCLIVNEDPIIDPDCCDAIITSFPWRQALDIPHIQIDPPGSTIAPVGVGTGGGTLVGCAGTVQVFFTSGGSLPFYGVRLDATPCDVSNPPCALYSGLPGVASCSANPIACCTPLTQPSVQLQESLCARSIVVRIDVNDDGFWDAEIPAAALTNPPC